MQQDDHPVQLRLDLVLNIVGAYENTAKITGRAISLATPHA